MAAQPLKTNPKNPTHSVVDATGPVVLLPSIDFHQKISAHEAKEWIRNCMAAYDASVCGDEEQFIQFISRNKPKDFKVVGHHANISPTTTIMEKCVPLEVSLDVEGSPSLRLKYLPVDKRCLVTRVSKSNVDQIISHGELEEFKRIAENDENPPKTFLTGLYGSENYVRRVGKKKRGNKAVNWRKTACGEFLCPSLHDANNIYEALGKKKWTRNQNKQKNAPADDAIRCSYVVHTGLQCSRRMCENSQHCTLHHKKITMNRIA